MDKKCDKNVIIWASGLKRDFKSSWLLRTFSNQLLCLSQDPIQIAMRHIYSTEKKLFITITSGGDAMLYGLVSLQNNEKKKNESNQKKRRRIPFWTRRRRWRNFPFFFFFSLLLNPYSLAIAKRTFVGVKILCLYPSCSW